MFVHRLRLRPIIKTTSSAECSVFAGIAFNILMFYHFNVYDAGPTIKTTLAECLAFAGMEVCLTLPISVCCRHPCDQVIRYGAPPDRTTGGDDPTVCTVKGRVKEAWPLTLGPERVHWRRVHVLHDIPRTGMCKILYFINIALSNKTICVLIHLSVVKCVFNVMVMIFHPDTMTLLPISKW